MGTSVRFEIFPARLDAAVDFYVRVLGFRVSVDRRAGPEPYVALARDAVTIGAARRGAGAREGRRPPTGVEVVLEVDDVVAERDRVLAAGWPLDEDLVHRPWGVEDFRLLDPDGYYLRVTARHAAGAGGPVDVRLAHSGQMSPAGRAAVRALLYEVFDDLEEDDWEHALGGMHATAWAGDRLVGHASIVERRLLHGGRALRAGYVEGVAVRAGHRRRGIASALMAALETLAWGAYEIGALGASDEAVPLYESRGWRPWRGPLSALTPDGVRPTPEDRGAVYVLPLSAPLDLDGELTCDWRDGDVW
jgi:aminoglycoside 2'-N-acetyltransferase I